jgi:hypothetical protein
MDDDEPLPASRRPWARFMRLDAGISDADTRRFAAVAAGFLGALLRDRRVRVLFELWRPAMLARLQAGVLEPPENTLEQAVRFIARDLGLPWPWIAFVLLDECFRDVLTQATGQTFDETGFYLRRLIIAPPIAVHTSPIPGESIAEARERVMRVCREALHALDAAEREAANAPHDRGRAPRRGGAHLLKYGRWFYEVRCRMPRRKILHIARSLPRHKRHANADRVADPYLADCKCRQIVRGGVAEAERLLELCAITWETLAGPMK